MTQELTIQREKKQCQKLFSSSFFYLGVWRSLVAHLVWDQGVAGSNPVTPTGRTPSGDNLSCGRQPIALKALAGAPQKFSRKGFAERYLSKELAGWLQPVCSNSQLQLTE